MNQIKNFLTIIFVFGCICMVSQSIFGQTIVRRQDFDANNTWTINETGSPITTANGTIATPVDPNNSTYGAASATTVSQVLNNDATSTAKGTSNGDLQLTAVNVPAATFTGNVDLFMSFRLAGIGLANGEGLDNGDTIIVSISLDGAPFTQEAIIRGGGPNASWNYNSGGTRTVNYDGNGTVEAGKDLNVTTQNNGADAFSKFTIRIPDAILNTVTTGVRLRLNLLNNRTDELWVVDDFIAYTTVVTAGQVSVGGRVSNAEGYGVSRATVVMTAPDGQTREAITNPFGYYRFDGLQSGESYVVEVRHKQFSFAPRVWFANESREDFDFVPSETSLKR
jgi:hypothetical protein